ncbi:aminotransferase class III-fold pyridoxal phosphate-dependent enzyme, partial [Salmonella enterica subsp. enterica serovar Enteritidis]|nr:aminotransferase class III-fold pyridoxal phosphate-dependent enzyme [Salmonella enterica subsp. enterica serovar Enteritidis]
HEDPKRVAAILIEPVVGSNGVIVYPDGYLPALRALTEKHGILLICDEVMTGFGRTGAPFASQRYGIVPDMITFAKGVTSAYIPLGGVMIREKLAGTWDAKALPSGHTYSGHPLCVAAGLATV